MLARLKMREVRVAAGNLLIHEGQSSHSVYTLLSGWAYRFRTLVNGVISIAIGINIRRYAA